MNDVTYVLHVNISGILVFNGRIRIQIKDKNMKERRVPAHVNNTHKILIKRAKFII